MSNIGCLCLTAATLKDQVIGIAIESEGIPLGILGLSPPVQGVNEYPYILDTMVDQGLIKSRAFSLDLRGVDNPTGAVIFGGLDTGKFIGKLAKLPILDPEDAPRGADRYYITMTGIGLTLSDGTVVRSEELNVPVFLDSGTTLSHLPTPIYRAIAASFPDALLDSESGLFILPCEYTEMAGSIDFYFAGKTIRVPLREFIWQTGGFCVLGVVPDDEEPILGDTFLRAAYVVYDQDNRNLHLAQAADCGSHLVAIGSGEDAVPSSTGRCTELPTPTTAGSSSSRTGGNLDISATRAPTGTFTGHLPTDAVGGPGPFRDRSSTTVSGNGLIAPTGTAEGPGGVEDNAAGRGVDPGLGATVAAAFGLFNVLAMML